MWPRINSAEAGRRHGLTGHELTLFSNGFAEALDSRAGTVAAFDTGALVAVERRRIARILAHPVPSACEKLRTHLAFESDAPAEQAIDLLETAAQIEASEEIASETYAARAERVQQLRGQRRAG
jgi:hypothetical protein